jgi:hypothetical protein
MSTKTERPEFIQAERETRCYGDSGLRVADDGGKPKIVGYAAKFNKLSREMGWSGFSFREKIAPGAFARYLAEGGDVAARVQHEGGVNVIARRSAKTLNVFEDEIGLRYEIDPADTQVGRDTTTLVRRRDLIESSFAFSMKRQSLEESEDSMVRTLLDVDLWDIAVVDFGAYQDTPVEVNALSIRAAIEASRASRGQPIEDLRRRLDLEGVA